MRHRGAEPSAALSDFGEISRVARAPCLVAHPLLRGTPRSVFSAPFFLVQYAAACVTLPAQPLQQEQTMKKTTTATENISGGTAIARRALPPHCLCTNPDECAQTMKVLSDPNRIRIVRSLISGACNVSAISERTGIGVHRISHHLGRMRLAGLVTATRDGRSIVYKITPSIAVKGGIDLGCARITFRPL